MHVIGTKGSMSDEFESELLFSFFCFFTVCICAHESNASGSDVV